MRLGTKEADSSGLTAQRAEAKEWDVRLGDIINNGSSPI